MAPFQFDLPDGVDESVRRQQPKEFYDQVLALNPQITMALVQSAAEAIAAPICAKNNVTGMRWDEAKGKFIFAAASDAKVVKDRWGKGLRAALDRKAGKEPSRLDAVESAVRLAITAGLSREQILVSVERGLRARR